MVKDNSRNISEQEKDRLIKICERLKKENADNIPDINLILSYIKNRKYGLVFEEHKEEVDELLEDNIPVFKEFKTVVKDPNSSKYNFLLEGDNLHSLKLLQRTHQKVDIIYIDPPYNTLNEDFTYGDKIMDKEDGFKHSKWLSFMKERLSIAYELLSDRGLLFISIDDNEVYGLKLLCDSIFREENFISNLVIETGGAVYGPKASNIDKKFVKTKDYVLVYQKNKQSGWLRQPLYDAIIKFDTHYSKVIINGQRISLSSYLFPSKKLWKMLGEKVSSVKEFKDKMKTDSKIESLVLSLPAMSMVPDIDAYLDEIIKVHNKFAKYDIEEKQDNISTLMDLDSEFEEYIYHDFGKKLYRDYPFDRNIPEEIEEKLTPTSLVEYDGFYLFKTSGGTVSYYKNFLDGLKVSDEFNPKFCRVGARGDFWKGFHQDMTNIDSEGGVEFKNGKKPKRLIKQLLKWANIPDAVVLDFFAGSGTTGHAVLEYNHENKDANMKFILCTNNEINARRTLDYLHDNGYMLKYKPADTIPMKTIENKISAFFEDKPELQQELFVDKKLEYEKYGICQSITFVRLCNVLTEMQEYYPTNLRYFQTAMVPMTSENLKYDLSESITTLIELEHFTSVNSHEVKVIWDTDGIDELMSMDLSQLQYLYIDKEEILPNGKQVSFLKGLENRGVKILDIPRYYYQKEVI